MELNGHILTLQIMSSDDEGEISIFNHEFDLLKGEESIQAVELLIQTVRNIQEELDINEETNYLKCAN